MIVDLYCSCWNNADIIPFFFRHYDPIVRKYIIFDDSSTDGSLELLNTHPRVEIRPMPKPDPTQARSITTLSPAETCWRTTSADADWVVMSDIDEHLYHADLRGYLKSCISKGVTIIPALGYQMVSSYLPADGLLCEQITSGAPWENMNKMNLFRPGAIERLNYAAGRHSAEPTGNIRAPDRDEVLLLHYKYLDFERVVRRNAAAAARLNSVDVQAGWGHRWRFSREQLAEDWASFEKRAVDIRNQSQSRRTHPAPRWWDRYRKSANAALPPAGADIRREKPTNVDRHQTDPVPAPNSQLLVDAFIDSPGSNAITAALVKFSGWARLPTDQLAQIRISVNGKPVPKPRFYYRPDVPVAPGQAPLGWEFWLDVQMYCTQDRPELRLEIEFGNKKLRSAFFQYSGVPGKETGTVPATQQLGSTSSAIERHAAPVEEGALSDLEVTLREVTPLMRTEGASILRAFAGHDLRFQELSYEALAGMIYSRMRKTQLAEIAHTLHHSPDASS